MTHDVVFSLITLHELARLQIKILYVTILYLMCDKIFCQATVYWYRLIFKI